MIAHRGASAEAPENTLAAFRLARAQGADGVELDVMRCGSGEVVVFHDDDLARLGGGSARDRVRRMAYAELAARDVGAGERIPLLDTVLAELSAPMLVNIELKAAPGFGARLAGQGLAREVAGLVRRHAAQGRVLVSSFDPLELVRFRKVAPEIPVGLLFSADASRPWRRAWASLVQPLALHPEAQLVDAIALQEWRARGYAVCAWTVDDPAEVRCLAALGVDAIITNRPVWVVLQLAEKPNDD